MLGYWSYATRKKHFFIFFLSKTQASQLIAIKDNKPCTYILKVCKKTKIPGYWPKPVTGYAIVACICMLQ
jgi:hypothetical protein